MAGEDTLAGLVYQQRYSHYRVLNQLALAATGISGGPAALDHFIVEGRGGVGGPIWDIVFVFPDGELDLHECKDTLISKDDRLTFYDRLRRQVAAGTAVEKVHPVWVTDPDKQTLNGIKYLESLSRTAESADLTTLPASLPERADSEAKILQEAVWRLCHFTGEEHPDQKTDKTDPTPAKEVMNAKVKVDWPRACTCEEAKSLLRNLKVAKHRFADLDQSIKLLSTGVFSTGTPASVQTFVTGVLTDRVVKDGRAEFSVTEFIRTIGTATLEHQLTETLRELMTFSAGSGLIVPRRQIVWRNLPGNQVTKWSLLERAPMYERQRSECIVADMGIGKTVASQLAFEEETTHRHPSRTLRIEARALERDRVDALLRLSCLLCGVGPTWIAIDGLDEIPSGLSQQWERVLSTLTALPNLTILVTVRREVLAMQEWLNTAISPLHRVNMEPLSDEQVEQAFIDVNLPIPKNRQLVSVLQNPFLLSLYADIVATTDMPLAESGEVTAFRVIEEFWKRRVRGVSTGQRAGGDSDSSQHAKLQATLFLGNQTVAGDLVLSRTGTDAETARGIEMLLREGVLREQGTAAVAWSHAWLREYSLIQTVLSGIAEPNALLLARRIVAVCKTDHTARSAAAAGLKWVVANPSAGATTDYLNELGKLHTGLAREGLLVLLEGSAMNGALRGLSDELLAEALTLAVSLKVPHWIVEVAALGEPRFSGSHGDRLHGAAVQYELVVCRAKMTVDTVRRLVARDLARWVSSLPSSRLTVWKLLDEIIATQAFGSPDIDEWLILVAGFAERYSFDRLLKAITGLLGHDETELAHKVFRATLGMDDAQRGPSVAAALVSRRLPFERHLVTLLETPGLLLNLDTWGRTAIELLAALIEAKQREDSKSRLRFAKERGEEPDEPFELRFDEGPRITAFANRDTDHPLVRIRVALDAAFGELVARPQSAEFRTLMEHALATRFAAVLVIPLFSLLDAGKASETKRNWHHAVKVDLLADASLRNCAFLSDSRRLLRRQLSMIETDHARVADGIRQSTLPPQIKIRELSEFVDGGNLTNDERKLVEMARTEGKLYEATDFRTEPLYKVGRNAGSGGSDRNSRWPHLDDADSIQLLSEQRRTGASETGGQTPTDSQIAKRSDALIQVLSRLEARNAQWIGTLLGWSTEFVEALRAKAQSQVEATAKTLPPDDWATLLTQKAPWWIEMADVAIKSLLTPPPSHVEKQVDGRLFWSSNDVFWRSVDFLDCLLVIEVQAPFAEVQARLVATVTEQWAFWPAFSKATVLQCLRPWYFFTFPKLRAMLAEIIRTEPDPNVVHFAADHILRIARSKPAPELATLLERVRVGDHDESLRDLAELLGSAPIFQTQPNCGRTVTDLAILLETALTSEWPEESALMTFLGGLLSGAREELGQTTNPTGNVYEAWLNLVEQVVDLWPFNFEVTDRQERFPLHEICSVLESESMVDVRTNLFLRLVPAFQNALIHGHLGTYCELHFTLKGLISGIDTPISGQEKWVSGIDVSEQTEQAFMTLCNSSMQRVVSWRKAGTQTSDWGWASSLRGEETVELMDRCMAASVDREGLRRNFLPLVDLLAAAGEPDRAAELRIRLRRY